MGATSEGRSIIDSAVLLPMAAIRSAPQANVGLGGCGPPQPISAKTIQLYQRLTKASQEPAFIVLSEINDLARRFKSPCNQPASRSTDEAKQRNGRVRPEAANQLKRRERPLRGQFGHSARRCGGLVSAGSDQSSCKPE